MAVILDNSVFYHIPKTGGTWVTQVLLEGVPGSYKVEPDIRAKDDFNGVHIPPSRLRWGGKKSFGFIRHPLSWYQSVWRYHNTYAERWAPDIEKKNLFYKRCPSTNFTLFMDKVMETFPNGYYGALLKEFLPYLDSIGKQESLLEDLKSILKDCNEDINRGALKIPPINESNKKLCDEYSKKHKNWVLKVESSIIERFYDGKSNNS